MSPSGVVDRHRIAVEPSKASFNSNCRKVTFTITNTSRNSIRVHIIRPISSFFFLSHNRPVSFLLAPGLQFKVHVHSQKPPSDPGNGKTQNVFDRILIRTDMGDIEVPLVYEMNRPNLQLDSRLTLNPVPIGQKATTVIQIRNEGNAEGEFTIVEIGGDARDEQVTITPNKGVVPGMGATDIKIEIQSVSPAIVKRIIVWQLDDRLHHTDLTAEFSESRFDLISSQQVLVTNPIDFGLVYMGAKLQHAYTLLNSSSAQCRFRIQIDQKSETKSNRSDDDEPGLTYQKSIKIERGPEPEVLSVSPNEGILAPYQAIPLVLHYNPHQAPIIKGFKSQLPNGTVVQYQGAMTIEAIDDPGRTWSIPLTGSAAEPNFRLSIDRFSFGSCPVNETADVIVQITNRSEDLDLPFRIERTAHFKCEPMSGSIPAMQTQDLIVSFVPHQLGIYQTSINVEFGHGLIVPIKVIGRSSTIGKRSRHLTGPHALPVDFKRILNLVQPLPFEDANGML